jgi:NAD(P)-dependent dehydrogenase (short-subunit alcohol dehydrogenase family)
VATAYACGRPGNRCFRSAWSAPTVSDMNDSRVWLITGSSTGFGRSIAEAALRAGDRVVATARRPETLSDLVANAHGRAVALPLDVTDQAQIDEAIAGVRAQFGRVDVLVNNAGYGSVGAVEELVDSEFRPLMETMFFGALALTRAVLPAMRAQGGGAIVQMSSMGGQVAPPGFGAYCAAKFALEAISESLSAEVAPFGIRVLIVEPGAFRTSFGAGAMHRSHDIGVYGETVGPTRDAVDAMDGNQPGDPAKAAAAVLTALDSESAPLRLALGTDAVDAIGAALDRRRSDLRDWAAVSRDTALDVT